MSTSQHITALIDRIGAVDVRWRDAMHAVPRHLFIPDRAWCLPDDDHGYLIDRSADPESWMREVYSDSAIITQLDDGTTDIAEGEEGGFTSSASAPGVVMAMLELLEPYDADEVLEVGTGTGWTAGLLAHRLGDARVTSIEIDRDVLKTAAENLKRAGCVPRLLLGDGSEGWAPGTPYDRVHVTVGVQNVPYALVEQTRPGGIIVLPWMAGWEGGHLTRLTVTGDGTAVGRFHGGCGFMMLRAQRPPEPAGEGDYRRTATSLDPRRVVRASTGADVAIAGMLPDVFGNHSVEGDGSFDLWLWSGISDAHAHYDPGYKQSAVRQRGPRDLWTEMESAFFRWVSWGCPGRERFGLTVGPDGQQVWLDDPMRPC